MVQNNLLDMKRLLLFFQFLIIGLPVAGQTTFNGFDVTDLNLAKEEKFSHYKQDIYLRTEDTGKFDAILIYTRRHRFVFADQHGEDTTFQSTYDILFARYGTEDRNDDSIPASYQEENLKRLKSLVRSQRARIHRIWNSPTEDLRQIQLIWDKGGLTLVFDS